MKNSGIQSPRKQTDSTRGASIAKKNGKALPLGVPLPTGVTHQVTGTPSRDRRKSILGDDSRLELPISPRPIVSGNTLKRTQTSMGEDLVELEQRSNKAFQDGNIEEAISECTAAIEASLHVDAPRASLISVSKIVNLIYQTLIKEKVDDAKVYIYFINKLFDILNDRSKKKPGKDFVEQVVQKYFIQPNVIDADQVTRVRSISAVAKDISDKCSINFSWLERVVDQLFNTILINPNFRDYEIYTHFSSRLSVVVNDQLEGQLELKD
ncbi:MAG: hypothetical protein AB7F64_04750 [Gammaproteobacteria bacterium]